jgi:hypothetical protein
MAGSSGEFWQVFLPDRLVDCFCPWMLLSLLARVCVKCVCVCASACVGVCACVIADLGPSQPSIMMDLLMG